MDKEFKVRDTRKKDQYPIDDAYLNGYAKLCGVYATAVYNSLSRHADFHTQECFPSIKRISEQHGIDPKTVIKAIAALEEWNIIKKIKEKDESTKRQKNNVYYLLDKIEWKPKPRVDDIHTETCQSRVDDIPKPSGFQGESRVDDIPCKVTHIKVTHIKVSDAGIAKEDIDKFIDLFKDISPMNYKKWFGRPPQRNAAAELLKVASLEKYENLVRDVLPKLNLIPYVSKDCKAFSPWELQKNFDKIRAKWLEVGKKEQKVKIITV